MSDSDSDVLTIRTESAVYRAKGPNFSSATNRIQQGSVASISKSKYANSITYDTNIFREPSLPQRSKYYRRETSPRSMCSLRDQIRFQQSLYHEPSLPQRSIYCRRETSPGSMCSLREQTRFQHSLNRGDMRAQRSFKNMRLGSPESVRSIESNISVPAREILNTLQALQNEKLSEIDMCFINKAYRKFMRSKGKSLARKQIEKRRYKQLMLRKFRRNSGNNSGDQASNSSLSSDESRVTTTRSLLSRGRDFIPYDQSSNASRTKINDIRRNMKYSNLFKDCTDNIKSNSFKNLGSKCWQMSERHEGNETFVQKDRFRNSFLLPSLRFNKSKDVRTITEVQCDEPERNFSQRNNLLMGRPVEEESEPEEIFSNTNVKLDNRKENQNRKRNITSIDIHSTNDKKRTKLVSPLKHSTNIHKNKENDFVFPMPQFPTKKRPAVKPKETLISKSAQAFDDTIQPELVINNTNEVAKRNDNVSKKVEEQLEITQNSINNVSTKPSFMKRKLFTQTLDITENKNISSDDVNTPHADVYSEIQKQKHKTRKLVTSQSCLSREIQGDNNLVNLISKIVPNDDLNQTVASKKQNGNITKPKTSKISSKSGKENQLNWDVTSLVSTCQDDNVSETYTDEEIFNMDKIVVDKQKTNLKKDNVQQKTAVNNDCVLKDTSKPINKPKVTNTNAPKEAETSNVTPSKENGSKNEKENCINNVVEWIWDTDLDSEIEGVNEMQKSQGKLHNVQATNDESTIKKPAAVFANEDLLKTKNDYKKSKEKNQKTIQVKQTNDKIKGLSTILKPDVITNSVDFVKEDLVKTKSNNKNSKEQNEVKQSNDKSKGVSTIIKPAVMLADVAKEDLLKTKNYNKTSKKENQNTTKIKQTNDKCKGVSTILKSAAMLADVAKEDLLKTKNYNKTSKKQNQNTTKLKLTNDKSKRVSTILNPAVVTDSVDLSKEDLSKTKNDNERYKEQNKKTIKAKQTDVKSKVIEKQLKNNIKDVSKQYTSADTSLEKRNLKIKMCTRRLDQAETEGNDSFDFLNFNLCKDRNNKHLKDGITTLYESRRVLRSRNKFNTQDSFDVNMNTTTHSDRVLRTKRPTVKNCCEETHLSTKSASSEPLNRTLRSRVIDISTPINSSNLKTVGSKTVKNKRSKKG